MDAGFYVCNQSDHGSPGFVVVKPKKCDYSEVHNIMRYFERNFHLPRHTCMDELIRDFAELFCLDSLLTAVSSKQESYLIPFLDL
jgi:hypothetical protein